MTEPDSTPESTPAPSASPLLAGGLLLGLLGDALFRGAEWGVNVPIWIGAVAIGGAWARRRANAPTPWLTGLLVFFALCGAWRASPFLRFWNLAAVLAAAVAITVHLRWGLASAWLRNYVHGAFATALNIAAGPVLTASAIRWPWSGSERSRRLRAIGIGTVLAVPVVLVFGALLASADPVMEAFFARFFDWDVERLLEHLWIIALLGWVGTGWLWAMGQRQTADGSFPLRPPSALGMLELGIPLGALLVLLASFVGLQARYFFAGEAMLRMTGMTYAELARRGFFELVFATALVVPLLLAAQWLLDRDRPRAVESFHALVVALLGVVLLVMLSALARMKLYVDTYGLTEDRLYASVFMGWIGFVLVWLAFTELRDRLNRFATGAVLAGFAVVAALNVLNPDAVIARTNVERAQRGLLFDAEYLGRLSSDAVPTIAARWALLDHDARCVLQAGVLSEVAPAADWRAVNWSRSRAVRALRDLDPAREDCPTD